MTTCDRDRGLVSMKGRKSVGALQRELQRWWRLDVARRGAAPWEKLRIRITGARIGNEIGVVIKDDGAGGAVVGCYSSSSSSSRLRAKVAAKIRGCDRRVAFVRER